MPKIILLAINTTVRIQWMFTPSAATTSLGYNGVRNPMKVVKYVTSFTFNCDILVEIEVI